MTGPGVSVAVLASAVSQDENSFELPTSGYVNENVELVVITEGNDATTFARTDVSMSPDESVDITPYNFRGLGDDDLRYIRHSVSLVFAEPGEKSIVVHTMTSYPHGAGNPMPQPEPVDTELKLSIQAR